MNSNGCSRRRRSNSMRNICSSPAPHVAPLRGASVSRAIRGFLGDSSPTAIVVSALRAGDGARGNQSATSGNRFAGIRFSIFAVVSLAMLLPHASFSAEKKSRVKSSAPSFVASVNGHTISVEFVFGKFDPKKRAVTKRKTPNGAGGTYDRVLINGKPVVGTDNEDPRRVWPGKAVEVIEEICIMWDGKAVKVPANLFDHVVAPRKETAFANDHQPNLLFSPEPSGEAVIVGMIAGEGAGTDSVHWLFRKDGNHKVLGKMFFAIMP